MIANASVLSFLQSLGWPEMAVIAVLALLIFGRRLPEVGRSLGKGIVEFKKGLRDTGDSVKDALPTKSELTETPEEPTHKEGKENSDFNAP
ncbi:MAG: twin-arginine translocase TatA/TatE family subunit [Planctomycetota bacterium]